MKRKILLIAIMAVALVCLFAFSVSAAEIPEWTDITVVDGMADKSVFGADGTAGATSRVLMSDGITYPAYYICNNSNSLGFNYKDLNSKTGKSYAAKDVVRLEVPNGTVKTPQAVLKTANGYTSLVTVSLPEGFTTLNGYTFYGSSSAPSVLVKVDFPSTLTTMGQNEFIDCIALEELIIPEGVTKISKDFARNATALKKLVLPSTLKTIEATAFRYAGISGEIVIPEGCTSIGQYAFADTNVKKVVLPSTLETLGTYIFYNCDSLTEVYSKSTTIAAQMFYACDNVTTVVLENTVTIGNQAFNNPDGGTTKINSLVLPEGITSIGDYAFTRCDITEVVLPSSLTTVGKSTFSGCLKLTKVVVLGSTMSESMFQGCSNLNQLVVTEKLTTMNKQCIGSTSASFTTYYTGTDYERICDIGVKAGADRFSASKTTYCTYEDYVAGNYKAKTCMIIYDINLCVAAFGGVHTEPQDDGDCTTAVICKMCAEHTFKAAKEHITDERITYESFLQAGEYYFGCTNDGCSHGTTEKREALFVCLGYSVFVSGKGGVTVGFKVNNTAVSEYAEVSGYTVSYGVFAVAAEKLDENDVFEDEDAIIAEINNKQFDIFELKIFGFTDENKDAKIALGAYVSQTNEQGTTYSCMQVGTPNPGEKYCFVSFNDLISE